MFKVLERIIHPLLVRHLDPTMLLVESAKNERERRTREVEVKGQGQNRHFMLAGKGKQNKKISQRMKMG